MIIVSTIRKPPRLYLPRPLPVNSPISRLAADILQDPSPVPLYHRLVRLMRELITTGVLRPGEQLPSEQYVAEQLRISRTTVRQAWQELEKAQLIVRDHGKGTFITDTAGSVSGELSAS